MSKVANWTYALAVAAGAIALCGCGSKNHRGLTPRPIEITAFTEAQEPDRAAPAQTAPSAPVQLSASSEPESAVAAMADQPAETNSAASTTTTAPAGLAAIRSGEQLLNPGDVIVLDTVVGQVSGRPIFADALLEPIADQLRREAQQLPPRDFAQRAAQIINSRMTEVVLTELFFAEAEASLSEEQQLGLFAFLRNLQEKTIASGQGSRTVTEERLMEELGLTIEQYTERERNALLIWHLINRRISPRVIVSWKDVQREYERRKAEFNPPSSVTVHILRLSNQDQAEQIQKVKDGLARGESFTAVVESIGSQGLTKPDPFPMRSDEISDIEINEVFKTHLAGLDVGQASAPFETEGRTNWLYVAAVDRPKGQTLFDVQRQLMRELQVRRETEERERYVRSLFAKGIHDELNEMSRRVLAVALMRYGR